MAGQGEGRPPGLGPEELEVELAGKVKPHKTVRGRYGIKKERVYGYTATRYRNCSAGNKKYRTFWAPYGEGWTARTPGDFMPRVRAVVVSFAS